MNKKNAMPAFPLLPLMFLAAFAIFAFMLWGKFRESDDKMKLGVHCDIYAPDNAAQMEERRPQMEQCVNNATEELLFWEQSELDELRKDSLNIHIFSQSTLVVANNALEELVLVKSLQLRFFPEIPAS
jgi:hypothetical protein